MFQETRAKQGNGRGTAKEQATRGNATEHAASTADIKDSRGHATERALSASAVKDPHFEKMYLEVCSNALPQMQTNLLELHALGQELYRRQS